MEYSSPNVVLLANTICMYLLNFHYSGLTTGHLLCNSKKCIGCPVYQNQVRTRFLYRNEQIASGILISVVCQVPREVLLVIPSRKQTLLMTQNGTCNGVMEINNELISP